jgi:hypothetical protein
MFKGFARQHYIGIGLFLIWIAFVVPLSIMTFSINRSRNETLANAIYERQLREIGSRFDSDLSVMTEAVKNNDPASAETIAADVKQLKSDVESIIPPDDYTTFHLIFKSSVYSLADTYTALHQGDVYVAAKNLSLTNQFMREANNHYP